jgi:hypothetical protein
MNDGLTAADREKLVGQLSRFPKLEKVVLFGSWERTPPRPTSTWRFTAMG